MIIPSGVTMVFENMRGEPVEVLVADIAKINDTIREGVAVVHLVGGSWFFIRMWEEDPTIEFTEEGEDNE